MKLTSKFLLIMAYAWLLSVFVSFYLKLDVSTGVISYNIFMVGSMNLRHLEASKQQKVTP